MSAYRELREPSSFVNLTVTFSPLSDDEALSEEVEPEEEPCDELSDELPDDEGVCDDEPL